MAGIGFELKKLFHRRGLMAMLRAYGYAGVICAGPMLLGVLLQFGVLIVSSWWQVGRPDRDLLVCMITYTLLASLVLTSFLSMPVTRFLADMLFDHDEKMILPSFWGSTGIMLVVGGLPMKWIAAAGGIAAAGVAAIMLVPSLHERAMERITIWKNPASDPLGTGYQILQSLYAIGSGGLMGSGIGNSRQKYLFLPEPQNDYVFSVVCEELGFIGALVVIVLFALLTWRGFTIVIKARDRFGAMLVTGFIAQVGVQAILNMAVVTNTIPSTGISLPFFSYGGTALAILLGEMGIVLSVSRQTTVEKE